MTEFSSSPSYQSDPADIRRLEQSLQQGIEQQLGYCGQDRFVLFYFDPQTQRVMWRDSRACGAGETEQTALFRLVEATAKACGVSVGSATGPGDHALLMDRVAHRATFSFREQAQEFLARRLEMAAN